MNVSPDNCSETISTPTPLPSKEIVLKFNPRIYSQFESCIQGNAPINKYWKELQILSISTSSKPQDRAFRIFSTVLKINQILNMHPTLFNEWHDMLKSGSLTVNRPNTPPHNYNFSTILQLAQTNKKHFEIEIREFDPLKDDTTKISKDIAAISKEAVGMSYELKYYERTLSAENTLCLLAICDSTVVGCLMGSYVEVKVDHHRPLHVIHFTFLGRKANYPGINLCTSLETNAMKIYEKFPSAEYFTLCMLPDNTHTLSHYKQLGFADIETVSQGFRGRSTLFLKKKISNDENLPSPKYAHVSAAVKSDRIERLGFTPQIA
ncbi:MAG: hypothetical protein VX777_05185 [Chlamydiota bacterium]|nr:hypothetical protein [Chlamydiota bacterium]